jgi:hypothetical protein
MSKAIFGFRYLFSVTDNARASSQFLLFGFMLCLESSRIMFILKIGL